MVHGLAHGHAVGVLLLEPTWVEMAGQCARAEEYRLVALPFLFGKADHLEAVGQATPLAMQLTHAGHGHEDAEAPVVLAAVAHRVVVAAGEQALGLRVGPMVDTDHVADGIDLGFVEAAVGAHPVRQSLRAGPVRVSEVGDGQLAAFGVARVAVRGQALGPVPDQIAEFRCVTELVIQAHLGDAVDVAQALGQLEVGVVRKASLKGGDDFSLVQTQAARATHSKDERKAELGVVVGVELLDLRELVRRAIGQAGLALLVRRLGGQGLAHHRLAGQFRVGADQRQLPVASGVAHHLHQRQLELRKGGERSLRPHGGGDPGRMFVGAVQQVGKARLVGAIERIQSENGSRSHARINPRQRRSGRRTDGSASSGARCRCGA